MLEPPGDDVAVARSTVQVAALVLPGALVEIDLIAVHRPAALNGKPKAK